MTGPHLTRRTCLALGAAALAARPAAAAKRLNVVELFTSQGCSSCPPADAFMEELVRRDNLIALSWNVDYWDYLGWKDTLARPEYSKRQYDYAKARGDMDVYTPQMIVNGGGHYVGSSRGAVTTALATAAPGEADLTLTAEGKEFVVTCSSAPGVTDATIWLMSVAPSVSVKIERGENTGSTVAYHNVVRKAEAVGMCKGAPMSVRVPMEMIMTKRATSAVALLQAGRVGAILGAARLERVNA